MSPHNNNFQDVFSNSEIKNNNNINVNQNKSKDKFFNNYLNI
jgi:hypothetical protein